MVDTQMTDPVDLTTRVEGLDHKLDQLSESVDRRFEEIDRRFEQVDRRFEQVDRRFEQVDKRFEQVDKRFEQVDKRFDTVLTEIAAEGERTRRHFDVALEQMKSERNLALDRSLANDQQIVYLTARNAAEHLVFERRLTRLEQDREQ